MEFDLEGNLLQAWGGPSQGYPWPDNEHGITVDAQDNVWLAGNGPKDGMILKFTRDGKHVMTIGQPGVVGNDSDTAHMNRPSNVAVDIAAGEIFVADGYGNHRVIVSMWRRSTSTNMSSARRVSTEPAPTRRACDSSTTWRANDWCHPLERPGR